MNETQPMDINSAPTEEAPIAEPARKPLSIASMLSQHLDWLQYDVEQLNQNVVSSHTRTAVTLSEVKADVRFVWIALFAVAAFLLMNAVMLGAIIYQLGILIGHGG